MDKTIKSRIEKYIPFECYQTIFDIDFIKLYAQGRRIILLDIDNTLLPYDIKYPTAEIISLLTDIKNIGFEVILISNNTSSRVKDVAGPLHVEGHHHALKPLRYYYKKIIKKRKYTLREYIAIGDQIMTDVKGAQNVGIDCLLVRAIKRKSEKWYTRFNRLREEKVLNKIKKYNSEIYQKIMNIRCVDEK